MSGYMRLRAIYLWFENLYLIGSIFRRLGYPVKRIVIYYFQLKSRFDKRRRWLNRVKVVLECPDNKYIPRVSAAGKIINGYQIMHNGLKILPNSHYGKEMQRLMAKNRGVHEPQEERVFLETLKYMPKEAVMIELGAYWSFYSMWFSQEVQRPSCFMVEPDINNLRSGQQNFAANKMEGKFIQALVGAKSGQTEKGIPIICVDDFVAEHNIEYIHILHTDIQGAEFDMLLGAQKVLKSGCVDYIFISTHSCELHQNCLEFLLKHDFAIIAEANFDESYSIDGLIAARRSDLNGLVSVPISKRVS